MVDLSWVHARPNLPLRLAKIDLLQPLLQLSPLYAMQRVNLLSYTAARAISESALQLPKDFQVYVTLFRLAHR
jgi:hypothetical protein